MAESNTLQDVETMTPEQLIAYLDSVCYVETLPNIETVEDMQKASGLLGHLSGLYVYLVNMGLRANVQKRQHKKNKETALYEAAMIRESIFQTYADQMKMLYNSTSRMVTIRQQVMDELRMGDPALSVKFPRH